MSTSGLSTTRKYTHRRSSSPDDIANVRAIYYQITCATLFIVTLWSCKSTQMTAKAQIKACHSLINH
jgi:hypothetical protein